MSHSANLVRRYKAERTFVWSQGGGQHPATPPQHTDEGGNYPRPRINRTNVRTTVPASRERQQQRGTRSIIVYMMLNALTLFSFLKDKQLKHKIHNKKWHTFYVIFVTLSTACGHTCILGHPASSSMLNLNLLVCIFLAFLCCSLSPHPLPHTLSRSYINQ